MTFAQAYKFAMKNSKAFRRNDARIKKAHDAKECTPVCIFSLADEAFYYGFDGVDLQKGKHTPKRSAYLIKSGRTLVVE